MRAFIADYLNRYFDELPPLDFYRSLGKHDKLIVDCENGDIYLPDPV